MGNRGKQAEEKNGKILSASSPCLPWLPQCLCSPILCLCS